MSLNTLFTDHWQAIGRWAPVHRLHCSNLITDRLATTLAKDSSHPVVYVTRWSYIFITLNFLLHSNIFPHMTHQYSSEVIGAAFKQTSFVREEMQILVEIFSNAPKVVSDEAGTHLKCSDSWSQVVPTPWLSHIWGDELDADLLSESIPTALANNAFSVLIPERSLSTFLEPTSLKRKPTKLSRALGLMILLDCIAALVENFWMLHSSPKQ